MMNKVNPAIKNISLATSMPLQGLYQKDLYKNRPILSREKRLVIVEQALALLEMSYIHLPQKRAMYAVDPVQRLKLLKYRIEQSRPNQLQDEMLFHSEMLEIFTLLRDLHTNYLLPTPFTDLIAYLPFRIEEYHDENGVSHFIVTWIEPGSHPDSHFRREVEVLYWNGIPIKRAVELNAARQAGSNPDARFARGLEALTIRPLLRTLPPDEEWVRLRYKALDGSEHDAEFIWLVYSQQQVLSAENKAKETGQSLAFGFDIQGARTQEARKDLMAKPDNLTGFAFQNVFRAREQATASGNFGYLRIFTFMHPDADEFVAEFKRLTSLLPQNGLIIDVRGNGGGNILACEQSLQLLAHGPIEPARFQFINSPLTLALSQRYDDLREWTPSIAQSVETGAIQSLGFPVTPKDACNAIGQVYHGPVLLITDALCYSATDIFTAGFQDHKIGKILGTSGNTGAGGANVWTHNDLCSLTGRLSRTSPVRHLFSPLPDEMEMRVAIRRCLRVGENAGIPVEDLGVVPDARHLMTRRDLLEDNADLLDQAALMLSEVST